MCLRILSNYILKMSSSVSRYTNNIVTEMTYSLFPSPVPRHDIRPFSFTSWPKHLKGSIVNLTLEVRVSQLTTHHKANIMTPDFILCRHPGGSLSIRERAVICDSETIPR